MSSLLRSVNQNLKQGALMSLLWLLVTPVVARGQAAGDFHPVVVTSSSGEIDPASQKILVETFSEVIRSSSLRSLGREFYGTSAKDGFAGVSSKGPIGLLRRALVSMDKEMADRVTAIHPKLKAPTTDAALSHMELFWTSRTMGSEVLGPNGDALGVLLKMLGPTVRKNDETMNPFALQLGEKAAKLHIATIDEVPGGRATLVNEARDAYSALRELNADAWVPLHLDSAIKIDKSKTITTRVAVTMIPVGFKFEKEKVGDFSIERTTYEPERDNRSVIRITFQRTYAADNRQRPPLLIKVDFGPLRLNGMDADVCIGDNCLKKDDSVPTIHALMDGGWLKNLFAKTLSLNQVKILIASLGINIEDLSVDPATSELPLLLQTYTFGWKVVDMKRNARPLNPLEAIQKALVGDQVNAGLSERLKTEGDKAETKINESLQAVVDLFR